MCSWDMPDEWHIQVDCLCCLGGGWVADIMWYKHGDVVAVREGDGILARLRCHVLAMVAHFSVLILSILCVCMWEIIGGIPSRRP